MNKAFYPRLAKTNIRKNGNAYFPYVLTCIGTIMMFYIMHAISVNEGLNNMSGGTQLKSILSMGVVVIGVFSAIFLFYTNSFLIKRRKKELGLYNILGMEKKHIAKMLFFESLFISFISLAAGLLGGIATSKLMFLVLLKILDFSVPLGFSISVQSLTATVTLFILIFLVTLLSNLKQIHFSNPVELLKGGQLGEKEPKTKWGIALIGFITLAGGYFIALWVKSPLAALNLFFIAVILVIIGTYALFTAGSIALLKLLRRNKSFYYKTRHFTSVSGMIYRMKQNAVGLANICILSTAVLVVLSTTVSLFIGQEDVLRTRFPRNAQVGGYNISGEISGKINPIITEEIKKHNISVQNFIDYKYHVFASIKKDNMFSLDESAQGINSSVCQLYLLTADEYNRLENKSVRLEKNEILFYSPSEKPDKSTINLWGTSLDIKEELESLSISETSGMSIAESFYVVVKSSDVVSEICSSNQENQGESYYAGFDLDGGGNSYTGFINGLRDRLLNEAPGVNLETAHESRESFFSVYGGLFFLGIFLGALFLMATVLIMYYKQISEGYDDKARFEIMKKVGMSGQEIKKSIRSQVLIVFFIPLVTSVIHIMFAFKSITKLLAILNLTNIPLFLACTAATAVIFALAYALVYSATARVYYKIVK